MMKYQPPSIYFLHIPKTAGQSLASLIRSAYPQELEISIYTIPEFLKLSRAEINKFKCFTGHFGTGLFELLDRDISCVTMLRNPFERAVSFIHFATKMARPDDLSELSNERKEIILQGNLKEFVNDPFLSKTIENSQTLYLGYDLKINNSGENYYTIIGRDGREIVYLENLFAQELLCQLDINKVFVNAKKRLDTMEVVGIVEQFNDSARLICDFLNIPIPQAFPQENISPAKLSLRNSNYRESGEIPDDVIKRIDELTAHDREIYEYGKTLFLRQLKNKKKKIFFF